MKSLTLQSFWCGIHFNAEEKFKEMRKEIGNPYQKPSIRHLQKCFSQVNERSAVLSKNILKDFLTLMMPLLSFFYFKIPLSGEKKIISIAISSVCLWVCCIHFERSLMMLTWCKSKVSIFFFKSSLRIGFHSEMTS